MTAFYPLTKLAIGEADARRAQKLCVAPASCQLFLLTRGCMRVAALGLMLSAASSARAQTPPVTQTPPPTQSQPPTQSAPPPQTTPPAQTTPAAQTVPPAKDPAAVQTPPAAAPAAKPAPTPVSEEIPGHIWGNYLVHQSVELGYRDSMIGGNLNNYDTFENLQSGMRLLDFSLDMHSIKHQGITFRVCTLIRINGTTSAPCSGATKIFGITICWRIR